MKSFRSAQTQAHGRHAAGTLATRPVPGRLVPSSERQHVAARQARRARLQQLATHSVVDRIADAARSIANSIGSVEVDSDVDAEASVPNHDGSDAATDAKLKERGKVGYEDALLFQVFGWDSCHNKQGWYNVVKSKVADLKEFGVTHAWLPPPSNSPVSPQGYMPGQLYNLDSKYGNKEQLKALNAALHEAGIESMADIVINHRCASFQSSDGTWNRFGDDVDHEGKKIDWDKWAITSDDPMFKGTGNPDTGEDYGPAPDLDHANPELREGLKHWLQWLSNEVGFDGWRLDFVKGYGAQFVKEYVDTSVGPDSVNVGEFWTDLRWNGSDLDHNQDAARQRLCDWIDKTGRSSAAFDFPTKGILQEAVKNTQYWRLIDSRGKAPGLMGWWPKRAVTFVDNHDTGSSQQHWPFPGDKVATGYAYILTHPGVPCLFWEHVFDWGDNMRNQIKTLVDVRKRNGIRSNSSMKILLAHADCYIAVIEDRLTVKLGPRYDLGNLLPKKEEGWKVAASGPDYAVWEKSP